MHVITILVIYYLPKCMSTYHIQILMLTLVRRLIPITVNIVPWVAETDPQSKYSVKKQHFVTTCHVLEN